MFESELFQVEAVDESVDEPDGVFFVNVLVDGIGKKHCLVSVGSVYVFAHGFSVVSKASLDLSLTVNSQQRKRLFTQSEMGSDHKRYSF